MKKTGSVRLENNHITVNPNNRGGVYTLRTFLYCREL